MSFPKRKICTMALFTFLLLMVLTASNVKAGVPYVAMYRVYNRNTGEHLFTRDRNEVNTLVSRFGWVDEGVGWYGDGSGGIFVYRLYNPNLSDHLYTMDRNEINTLTARGWRMDFNGSPVFYSGGNRNVYRLYNRSNGRHHLTRDLNEYNTLGTKGWNKEGVAMQCME